MSKGRTKGFYLMIFPALFILPGTVLQAQGGGNRLLAQSTPYRFSSEDKYSPETAPPPGNVDPFEEDSEIVLPDLNEGFEFPADEEKRSLSHKERKYTITGKEEETRQVSDTCSQMLQFSFVENVIQATGLSVDLPPDFVLFSREQAFDTMVEILIRRGFSIFYSWDNIRAVKRDWHVDFLYGILQRDELMEPEASLKKRQAALELGGYVSGIWGNEDCACYENIAATFNDVIVMEILDKYRPAGQERPFPYYQGRERELLEADLVNIVTTATGLGKRMYMSRQGISEEDFCKVQHELLLASGYTEFTSFDCVSYVSKTWYIDFLYYILARGINLPDASAAAEKIKVLAERKYLPDSVDYQRNIYENDIYLAVNDPLFIELLNQRQTTDTGEEEEGIPEFPNVYEEPVSLIR